MYISSNLPPDRVEKSALVSRLVLLLIFIVIFFAFWNIQILKHDYYNDLALGNISDSIETKAPRGVIVDKSGTIIAENKINFILFLNRKRTEDIEQSLINISYATGTSLNYLQQILKKYRSYPSTRPIPLLKDLSINEVIYIKSRPSVFKEFEIEVEPDRAYPLERTASHIIGYMSEITESELKVKSSYDLGDLIGKSGIEKQYESFLKGTKGRKDVIKNNLGVIKKTIHEIKPKIGDKIHLTLDIRLQKSIESLLKNGNHKGTVGVVNLKTGGIIAMVSTPCFNPSTFWNKYPGFDASLFSTFLSAIISNPNLSVQLSNLIHLSSAILETDNVYSQDYSLHNKFIQGRYSPGSIFKIVMAIAGLEKGIITNTTKVYCSGVQNIYNRPFHCWQEYGHGSVDLKNALKDSCNIYFYNLGKKINIDDIYRYSKILGLSQKTGIDIPNEISGLVPTSRFKFRNNRRWFPGDTISISIGGGMLEVTPIQALLMISTVALRGNKPVLHILNKIESNGKVIKRILPRFLRTPIKKEHYDFVIDGLFSVVNQDGTGKLAKSSRYAICGKTGTQQIISKENPKYKELVKIKKFMPHAWFVSFVPKENPLYASVVFIENGGGAGTVAAPLALKIYKEILDK